MRDIVIIALVVFGSLAALRRPWIGMLVWTWLSIMNPHRYSYGVAYDAPLAAIAAAGTLMGLLFSRDKRSPFIGSPPLLLLIFMIWMTLSWQLGLDPDKDFHQWSKVMKIDFMILVALALVRSKFKIMLLLWVAVGSVVLLGAKGGVFTLLSGGSERVWGPPGSFIEDNNEFACALVMTVPLLRFLQLQCEGAVLRKALLGIMILCALSAFGSQSRGALLAISAMSVLLWWRGKGNRLVGALVIITVGVAIISFMPAEWGARMNTIQTYEQDGSAMGRISAWWNAWNLAFHYPFGVGFNAARPELFARYSPYPDQVQGAHSIYFLVLGNHGFIGLFIYLSIWVSCWRVASWLRTHAAKTPQAAWAADLGNYGQVSLIAFAVGGAFLSLSYFDMPYVVLVVLVAARAWVQAKGWEADNQPRSRLWRSLGLWPSEATKT